jgi:hypothetical protein
MSTLSDTDLRNWKHGALRIGRDQVRDADDMSSSRWPAGTN